MLGEIGTTISTVQREADEVAAFAEELAASAQELHATSEAVTHTAQNLATDLGSQRCWRMPREAKAPRPRTKPNRCASARSSCRSTPPAWSPPRSEAASEWNAPARRCARWGRSAGHRRDRRRPLRHVGAYRRLRTDRRADRAPDPPARPQRRHRGGEGGRARRGLRGGRRRSAALAAQAGKSAREVAELVAELRTGIDAAARAMQSGEAKVRDIGAVSAEADARLQELHQGVELMGDLVNATAEVSRSQAQRLVELAQPLDRGRDNSTRGVRARRRRGGATQAQIISMGDLTATSQQLAQLPSGCGAVSRASGAVRAISHGRARPLPARRRLMAHPARKT